MSFLDSNKVNYACSCGRLKPLCRLYFCRHCFLLRCKFCVFHEIDSEHCAACLESFTLSDSWLKGSRCSNCLQCPKCQCNLTTRISRGKPNPEAGSGDDAARPKTYYLACLFCRWSSRDVGIPDAATSANAWPVLENPHAKVLSELVEYYKAVAINDTVEREKKTHGSKRTYTHITGMSAAMVRMKAGLAGSGVLPFRSLDRFQESLKNMKVTKVIAQEIESDLPEDIYTKAPDLTQVTTLVQRHRQPEVQPTEVSALRCKNKYFEGRLSFRCRTCEHNLIKPEFWSASTKFKIQLSAYYLVPELRIKTVEPLRAGLPSELLLLFVNPTQHPTTITLLPLDHASSDTKTDMVSVPIKCIPPTNSTGEFPADGITLPGRDDAAEFDEPTESQYTNDDRKVVVWRKANKVVIRLSVVPNQDLPIGDDVLFGLTLSHVYTNTVILQEKKQLNQIDHAFKVILNLGKTVST